MPYEKPDIKAKVNEEILAGLPEITLEMARGLLKNFMGFINPKRRQVMEYTEVARTDEGIPICQFDMWEDADHEQGQVVGVLPSGEPVVNFATGEKGIFATRVLFRPLTMHGAELDHSKYTYKYPGVKMCQKPTEVWPQYYCPSDELWISGRYSEPRKEFYRCLITDYCTECKRPKAGCPCEWVPDDYIRASKLERACSHAPGCEFYFRSSKDGPLSHGSKGHIITECWHDTDAYYEFFIPKGTYLVSTKKPKPEGCNTPDVSDQPTNLPEGWKAYRLNWFCGNPSFMLSNNQQDHVCTTDIRWYGYISMDDKQAYAQRGFLWGDEYPDYKDDSLKEHPFPADADNPATWILFSKV